MKWSEAERNFPAATAAALKGNVHAARPGGAGPKGRGETQRGDFQENAKFFQKMFGNPNISSTFASESDITINNIAYEKFNNRFD